MPPKRRRRFQGLYYHSSPPKVIPMNGKEANQVSRRRRDADDFSVKLSTIRIWMHEKDIGKLTRILWAGQGHRLCQQASNNARIKRFLAAVPHVMNEIKDVHQAVIDNNLETLVAKLEAPVPSALVQCKDANGLNIIHKAAGLGHTKILEHIIGIWPEGIHETDVTGKTPLHWAASAKNNMRCYTLLTQAGCDEEALDYKMKTPSYYRHKPHEIERAFLVYVPEAPRVSPDSTTDWEALSSDDSVGGESKKLDIKLPDANGVADKSVAESIENTSELDLHDGVSAHEEDEISKDDTNQALEAADETAEEPEAETKAEENQIDENGVEDVIANVTSEHQNGDDNNNNYNNHDNNHDDDVDDAGSPTSSLAIEGFVQGEPEDNTVQSQTAAYVDEDARIQQIIESGDMEQLADIVLNGDGNKLLGLKSQNMEIQAFLNNVPTYMNKIHRVHDAARDGSLLTLQQALDRRKFAVARDEITPNGATPLHVAVLFGNVDILRYLAGRFPETMAATDNDGRTPLHYAATIKDNGHFYNILLQLGANPKTKDKLGHTPEYFFDHPIDRDILNYKQLLSTFGAEELENQLLCDQGQVENQSFHSNPIFKTEQGKYLADSLADPLIKALTEIANKRPEDPIAYLAGYLHKYVHTRKPTTEALVHSSSSNTSSTALVNSHRSSTQNAKKSNINSFATNVDNIEEDGQELGEEEDDAARAQQLEERDEHGQSMLHFACARSHRRGSLFTLIEESHIDITYRDELYRTARDVALQANQPANAKEIDRYVLSLAIVGDIKPFEHLSVNGYDHVLDVTDDNGKEITEIVAEQNHEDLTDFLRNMRSLEETREELHQMIRENNVARVKEITAASNGKWFIRTKNYYGRTALHIAVLKESTELVELFVNICPEALKISDNLERTVLHYAMGTNAIETLSRILIQKGAKRTAKDLKGRQPSYYFMNKADILRLQEEEDENR